MRPWRRRRCRSDFRGSGGRPIRSDILSASLSPRDEADLAAVVEEIVVRSQSRRAAAMDASPFAEITDEDIDALFG